ncbi:HNH endonuclease [Bacillus thuringiensis]|uniref:HNH endonuclease n=1 Tax=Bacillus thuringiensis TaxID=1428 RepID=UPI0011A24659|nr:HNH endonuclease [Bacillus thuringiensis]
MIRLHRPSCPQQLTDEEKDKLTKEFINNKKNVWAKPYIKSALLKMSYNKCAYCECKLDRESQYMEVEHFLPKDDYPHQVVEWDNLLPSCKRCNSTKRKHDSNKEPIINPANDTPNEHLIMNNYWIRGKDEKGKTTVSVLNLNQVDRLVQARLDTGVQTIQTIESLLDRAENFITGTDTKVRNRNALINGSSQLLKEAQPDSQFSATVASVLFTDPNFYKLKDIMINCGLWEHEHIALLSIAEKNILNEPMKNSVVI